MSPHRAASSGGEEVADVDLPSSACLAVVVHFGDVAPTIRIAAVLAQWADVVVAVNDGTARPAGLDSRIEWHMSSGNVGYAGGFAEAVAGRSAECYVVLNNDVVIEESTWRRCLDAIAQPSIWVAAPVMCWPDGTLQSGAGRLTKLLHSPTAAVAPSGVTDCEWVTGAVMFLRPEAVTGVRFDALYFLGSEDVDLCVRVRRAGGRVVCVGGAEVLHERSRVVGSMWPYYTVRNRVWSARKLFGVSSALLTWTWFAILYPRILLADLLKRRDLRSSRLHLRGLRDSFWGVWREPVALPGEPRAAR
jgi:GT2 family glycosyltransferase